MCILKRDKEGQIISNQRISYDGCGNKCCEIHDLISQGEKIGNHICRWIHGPGGRIEEEIEAYGTDREKKTKYLYNTFAQLVAKEIPGFTNLLEYSYNTTGKLKSIKYSDSTKHNVQQVANIYEYNTQGLLIKAASEVNPTCTTRNFNAFGQMTSETIEAWRRGYTVEYAYDRKGRIKTIVLPDQSSISYTYDGVFCRSVQRLSEQGEVLYSHLYNEYDQNGCLLNETLMGEIGERRYEYDLNGKITVLDIPNLCTQKNQYDVLSRLVEKECKGFNGISSSAFSFGYDDLSQLTSEQNQEKNVYEYDSLNNRIKINDDLLVYDASNQLKAHGDTSYTYDSNGHLSNRRINRFNLNIYNNVLSEMRLFVKADKKKLFCLYDALGRRVMKNYMEPNNLVISSERFLYLGNEEVGTIDAQGNIIQLRVPGIDGETLSSKSIGIEIKNKTYTPIHGIEGNIVALVEPVTSSVQESYSYTAFGMESIYDSNGVIVKESVLGNPWRYSEKRVDKEIGMIFFGRRFYNPKEGRWLNPDPLGTLDGPNTYAYVHNNPMNCRDHFGLFSEEFPSFKEALMLVGGDWDKLPRYYFSIAYFIDDFCGTSSGNRGGISSYSENCNQLPTITYHDSFENTFSNYNSEEEFISYADLYDDFRTYYEPSKIYHLNKPERKDFRIGFINGIKNTFAEAKESIEYISKIAGGYNVHAVYNATHGLRMDLHECQLGLNYVATDPVRQLHKMWNQFFDESSSNSKFLMICHSQGAIHVRNALLDYPENLRERILVVAIAPGAYIYQQTCADVVHYRVNALRDFVPRFDSIGALREKNSILELSSHPDAPYHDHTFLSPTYHDSIFKNINGYLGNLK